MQTVLAMVTILPVLQKPNALFTLCIHQKIHDKVFQECWSFFFWRGKKTRNLPIIIKRSPLVPISLNTSSNSLTICNNQVVIFSLFPSITINTDFYSSGKKNTYFEGLRAELFLCYFLQTCKKAAFHYDCC